MPTMADRSIRTMQLTDVDAIVAVHLGAFQSFFLSFLGPAFLRELYAAIVRDPSGISYVCEQDGQIRGFVAGTTQPSGLYRRLLRQRWWRFGLASVWPALKRPLIIPRLLRAFRMPRQSPSGTGIGTLMSIAVSPPMQGSGIGKALLRTFLQEARRRGLKQVNLTTDRLGSDAVNRFYQQLGFTRSRTYVTPEGREMQEYLIDL